MAEELANVETLEITLLWCARCGPATSHPTPALVAKKFKNPIVESDGTVWTHWATCPITGDPVLVNVFESQEHRGLVADGLDSIDWLRA